MLYKHYPTLYVKKGKYATPCDPRATPFPTPRNLPEVLLYKPLSNLRPFRPLFDKNWEMPY